MEWFQYPLSTKAVWNVPDRVIIKTQGLKRWQCPGHDEYCAFAMCMWVWREVERGGKMLAVSLRRGCSRWFRCFTPHLLSPCLSSRTPVGHSVLCWRLLSLTWYTALLRYQKALSSSKEFAKLMLRHNLQPEAVDFLRVNIQPMGDKKQWNKAPVPPSILWWDNCEMCCTISQMVPQQDWAQVAHCLIKTHIIAVFPFLSFQSK